MQAWETWDQIAWVEIAGLESAGPNFAGVEKQDHHLWNTKCISINVKVQFKRTLYNSVQYTLYTIWNDTPVHIVQSHREGSCPAVDRRVSKVDTPDVCSCEVECVFCH